MRVLYIDRNLLTELPAELGSIEDLGIVQLQNNPLEKEYPKDTQELLEYLRQQQE